MKKIAILGLIVLFIGLSRDAQSQTTFGFRAGVNFQNINGRLDDGSRLDLKIKPGVNLGVNVEIPIGIDFYLQPGLLFSTKGASERFDDGNKVSLSYLEVPVLLLYKPDFGYDHLLLGAGPYLALGVGGKVRSEGTVQDIQFKNNVSLDDPDAPYFRKFDAGLSFLVGYEMSSRVSVQLNASFGIAEINPVYEGEPDDRSSYRNNGFGISLGYRLP